jgi:endo-1,4-beta-xylanase
MNTRWNVLLLNALLTVAAVAATPPEIVLWPDGAPGSEGKTEPELQVKNAAGEVTSVSRIHRPSLTPYLPDKAKANGAAVLVIPGGGHRVLAIQHEGWNVAEWLRERGIAAFVLKHRLARETNSTYRIEVEALADTQRAMRLIRSRVERGPGAPRRDGFQRGRRTSVAGEPQERQRSARCERRDRAAGMPSGVSGIDLSGSLGGHRADEERAAGVPLRGLQ